MSASATVESATPAVSPAQIAIVKSTAPLMKEHGVEITTLFYNNLLAANPGLNNVFSQSKLVNGAQPRALASAVFAYASYIDDLAQLGDLVECIAHKHVSLKVEPEQYAVVGKFLLEAVVLVLGDAVTSEVADAWNAAYNALANVFIIREKQMYAALENWTGWRRFKIQKKVPESARATSFYMVPEDGQVLPLFKPGQYISIRIPVPQLGCKQPRQYSLSEAPLPNHYRITVKKEGPGSVGIPGLISNMLHGDYNEGDIVELSHPVGNFFVEPSQDVTSPLVLISAGVGVTPMMAIANSLPMTKSSRPVTFIHGAHDAQNLIFGSHIKDLCAKNSNIKAVMFRSVVQADEKRGIDYDFQGRVDLAVLDQKAILYLDKPTEYYVCGPIGFMNECRAYLKDAGVNKDLIHSEVFGVGETACLLRNELPLESHIERS